MIILSIQILASNTTLQLKEAGVLEEMADSRTRTVDITDEGGKMCPKVRTC